MPSNANVIAADIELEARRLEKHAKDMRVVAAILKGDLDVPSSAGKR